jgi:hypothetical protein
LSVRIFFITFSLTKPYRAILTPSVGALTQIEVNHPPVAAGKSSARSAVDGSTYLASTLALLRKKYRPHYESIYQHQIFAIVFVVRCTLMSFI